MLYDAIILGSGHNSLILQAYLGRAGLKTVCLEQAERVGGGLSTVEYPLGSGFQHNTHSFYHRGLTGLPWYNDLKLEQRGAHYLQPDLNVVLLCGDGRSLEWWSDFDRTLASFATFSPRDAETLAGWRERFRPIVRDILVPESRRPPVPQPQRTTELERTADGRQLLETSQLSPLEFVRREFEHPVVQAGLLFFNGLREVDLRLPGFGHHIPALLASDAMAQMCCGGSARLADALVSAVVDGQGEIRTSCRPTKILIEADRVAGVETDGETIRGARVVSGLNPQQTFLELLEPRFVPSPWLGRAEQFKYNVLAPLFALNVNLNSPPQYLHAADHVHQALMTILGLERPEQFEQIVHHHEAGTIPETVMWGSCPTRFDPQQAPEGKHTAFCWEKLPFALRGDPQNWSAEAEDHARRMLDRWTQFAPDLRDAVEDQFWQTPLQIEQALPNMRGGDLLVGSFDNDQVGYHRPFPGAGHYRGHIPGLYLCGSCCHPGGNITGLPGYNCAQVVLGELGIELA